MRTHPILYQINALSFLQRLNEANRLHSTISDFIDRGWRMLMNRGFDLVWLMGVWQRSPEARKIALNHQGLREHYTRILPGWNDDDVTGSPYAVYSYEIDSRLGSKEEFLQVKSRLNQLGIKLILDFVPNHLAIDH